jgi:hypothetical protein
LVDTTLTFAIFQIAEFGFFGFAVQSLTTTAFFCGQFCKILSKLRIHFLCHKPRINCPNVGILNVKRNLIILVLKRNLIILVLKRNLIILVLKY